MLQASKTFDKVSCMFYFSLMVVKFSYFLKSLKSFLRISDQEVVTHILQSVSNCLGYASVKDYVTLKNFSV